MTISSLKVQNYKLLKDLEIEKLGQINLLVGKNDSGKSTVQGGAQRNSPETPPDLHKVGCTALHPPCISVVAGCSFLEIA